MHSTQQSSTTRASKESSHLTVPQGYFELEATFNWKSSLESEYSWYNLVSFANRKSIPLYVRFLVVFIKMWSSKSRIPSRKFIVMSHGLSIVTGSHLEIISFVSNRENILRGTDVTTRVKMPSFATILPVEVVVLVPEGTATTGRRIIAFLRTIRENTVAKSINRQMKKEMIGIRALGI